MENNKHNAIIRKDSHALMKRPETMDITVAPMVDIFETSDVFVVKLDLPCVTKESIDVSIRSDQLSVRVKVGLNYKDNAKLLFSEINWKNYLREFRLGNGINREKLVAQYEDGVLTITLPKTAEVKAREIPIH